MSIEVQIWDVQTFSLRAERIYQCSARIVALWRARVWVGFKFKLDSRVVVAKDDRRRVRRARSIFCGSMSTRPARSWTCSGPIAYFILQLKTLRPLLSPIHTRISELNAPGKFNVLEAAMAFPAQARQPDRPVLDNSLAALEPETDAARNHDLHGLISVRPTCACQATGTVVSSALVFARSSRSECTISWIRALKPVVGFHPRTRCALPASPMSKSTSAGRKTASSLRT